MKKPGMIAEFERHYATIAMFPFRSDIWRDNAVHMQHYILDLVSLISKYESVILVCRETDVSHLRSIVNGNVRIVPMEYDDIWARDIGPTFVRNNESIEIVNWKFNAWGGLKEGSYYPWDKDDAFASAMADYLGLNCSDAPIVLEGGAILSDGEGTLFTTRSVLLNRNRNPFKTKSYIERVLKEKLLVNKIVWLEQGLAFDETNGHIDNVMSVVRPHEICLAWTDDVKNPNYKRVRKIQKEIQDHYDCKINKLPLPQLQFMTTKESDALTKNVNAIDRKAGDLLPASYLNYYTVNDAVIIPAFGCEEDAEVYQIMKDIYPDRVIEQIYSREPLLGGGGIHCLLHEIPELR